MMMLVSHANNSPEGSHHGRNPKHPKRQNNSARQHSPAVIIGQHEIRLIKRVHSCPLKALCGPGRGQHYLNFIFKA